MHPAIVIVDVLQDFFREGRLRDHKQILVSKINELTDFARQKNIPIIWVRQEFEPDLSDAHLGYRKSLKPPETIKGTGGEELLPDLRAKSSDYEVVKKRYSAFFKTNLQELLQRLQADTIVIGGVNTHACIRQAAIDAYQYDYDVILATDCIDSYDEEHHKISLEYLSKSISEPKTNKEIFKLLAGK